jgi:hypothetical protein
MKNATNYSNKTELEVIEIYKNNAHWRTKQEIEAYFYQKYTPYIKGICTRYRNMATIEDNMQDCYFLLVNALEYVDENKVSNKNNFSFQFILNRYITAHFIGQAKSSKKQITEHMEEYITRQDQEYYKPEQSYTESHESEIINKVYKEQFEKTLSNEERVIFNMMYDRQKLDDIAKAVNKKCKQNLKYYRDNIQRKFNTFSQGQLI